MTNEQKRETFEAAFKQLVLCIRLKNPPDMRDRSLTSVFAYHMMPAEGRKNLTAERIVGRRIERDEHSEADRTFAAAPGLSLVWSGAKIEGRDEIAESQGA